MRPANSPHRRVRLLLERLEDHTAPAVSAISAADPNMLCQSAGGALPTVSKDGQFIAFTSRAANVVDGVTDTNGGSDLFLLDRATGMMTLETVSQRRLA